MSSFPDAFLKALVHLVFLGLRFFLKFLMHFDLQNLKVYMYLKTQRNTNILRLTELQMDMNRQTWERFPLLGDKRRFTPEVQTPILQSHLLTNTNHFIFIVFLKTPCMPFCCYSKGNFNQSVITVFLQESNIIIILMSPFKHNSSVSMYQINFTKNW